jgi:hypothetical protein
MNTPFYNRQSVLFALAAGGLIAFARDLAAAVALLYRFALTPQGGAALLVGTMLLSAASLVVAVLRR